MSNVALGKLGEEAALEYLLSKGCKLCQKNYRAERCEIDLIVWDGDVLVFVEVKARHKSGFGTGREAVTVAKQRNVIKAATIYAIKNGLTQRFMRFDVVEVELNTMGITHIENAFQ